MSPAPNLGRIAEIDLDGLAVSDLSEIASKARFQWPSYSPSGLHVAYLDGEAGTAVRVDGREIFACGDRLGPDALSWVSDEALAIAVGDTLRVVDARSGALRGPPISIGELRD